jgi:2-oxoglutarate dehydrogenase E2 component (dihydrolipoamide succinyltransferase)
MTAIRMPQLGLTMEEGTIQRWLKREGEAVAKGEPLFEVETDKVVMEVEAPASGTLAKIIAADNQTVKVGAEVGMLED